MGGAEERGVGRRRTGKEGRIGKKRKEWE